MPKTYAKRPGNARDKKRECSCADRRDAVVPTFKTLVIKSSCMLQTRFCIAPMMDWTDRHCRFFHRLLTRRTLIYTEMVTTGAVLNGDRDRLIGFDPFEHPVAIQLGGSDPRALAASARIAEDFGYDEINFNV